MGRVVSSFYIRKTINFIRAKKIEKQFYVADKNIDECITNKKEFVFCANGFLAHGGLADRIYGILTTYAICKIKNWKFAIHFNSPYNLEDFLVPNMYDWRIATNDIRYNLNCAKPILRMGGCYLKPDFDSIKPIKKQIHFYSNYKNLDGINNKYGTAFTWAELFKELFRVSDVLQRDLNAIMEKLPEKYISLQLRVQNAFGDFPDCGSTELSDIEKECMLNICEKKINSVTLENKMPILLTSDSQRLIDYFQTKKKDSLCFIPGTVLHTDNTDFSGYDAHKKTFIDLFCLAAGKEIYQIENENIYRSGFSKLAAQITERNVKWL